MEHALEIIQDEQELPELPKLKSNSQSNNSLNIQGQFDTLQNRISELEHENTNLNDELEETDAETKVLLKNLAKVEKELAKQKEIVRKSHEYRVLALLIDQNDKLKSDLDLQGDLKMQNDSLKTQLLGILSNYDVLKAESRARISQLTLVLTSNCIETPIVEIAAPLNDIESDPILIAKLTTAESQLESIRVQNGRIELELFHAKQEIEDYKNATQEKKNAGDLSKWWKGGEKEPVSAQATSILPSNTTINTSATSLKINTDADKKESGIMTSSALPIQSAASAAKSWWNRPATIAAVVNAASSSISPISTKQLEDLKAENHLLAENLKKAQEELRDIQSNLVSNEIYAAPLTENIATFTDSSIDIGKLLVENKSLDEKLKNYIGEINSKVDIMRAQEAAIGNEQAKVFKLTADLNHAQSQLKQIENETKQYKAPIHDISTEEKSLELSHRSEADNLLRIQNQTIELAEVENRCSFLIDSDKKSKETIAQLHKVNQDAVSQISDNDSQIKVLKEKLMDLTKLNSELSANNTQQYILAQANEAKCIDKYNIQIQKVQEDLSLARFNLDGCRKEVESLTKQLRITKDKAETVQQSLQEKINEMLLEKASMERKVRTELEEKSKKDKNEYEEKLNRERAEIEVKFRKDKTEIEEKYKKENAKALTESERLKKDNILKLDEFTKLSAKLKQAERDSSASRTELQKSNESHQSKMSEISARLSEHQHDEVAEKVLRKEVEEITAKHDSIVSKHDILLQELEVSQNSYDRTSKLLTSMDDSLKKLKTKLDEVTHSENSLRRSVSKLERERDENVDSGNQFKSDLDKALKDVEVVRGELAAKTIFYQTKVDGLESLIKESGTTSTEIAAKCANLEKETKLSERKNAQIVTQ